MQFSENWLRTIINPNITSKALSELLTISGLEVEKIEKCTPLFSDIVVGKILCVMQHPYVDTLKICEVDIQSAILNIVSSAFNIRVGMKIPCAVIGAMLPSKVDKKLLKIKIKEFFGVKSYGMLCSMYELKLSEDHDNVLELPDNAPVGKDFRDYYFPDDYKFTIKPTPNRADCLSLFGIAREVSALTNTVFKKPLYEKNIVNSFEKLPVKILTGNLCGRFTGRIIRGLNAKAIIPLWMRQRLECSGQHSISALVDISNYVMLELGHPSHIFDLDKIEGKLNIRWGKKGEQLKLLNDHIIDINEWIGVVADNEKVEALAGIMGGKKTAISLDTKNIYLEMAFWFPQAIHGRTNYYKFSTDAAYRFERGVDFANTLEYIERITFLLVKICGGIETKICPIDDHIIDLPKRNSISVRVSRVHKIVGIMISDETIANIFKRLGFNFIHEPGLFIVNPPSYRFDIKIEEDLIEEIIRIYGFENIPALLPISTNVIHTTPENTYPLSMIRHLLTNLDYQEVINFSFVDSMWEIDFSENYNPIKLRNPIASHMDVMRSSLIASLVANARYNINRKINRIRLFEISTVFLRNQEMQDGPLDIAGYSQPKLVAGLAYGPLFEEQWGQQCRNIDFFDVKSDLEVLFAPRILRFVRMNYSAFHPGRAANIMLENEIVGIIGELHPNLQQKYDLFLAPMIFELNLHKLQKRDIPVFTKISRFPVVTRDLAIVVEKSIPVQKLFDIFMIEKQNNVACKIIKTVILFDKYFGKELNNKEKSFTFRFTLQDSANTLRENVIDVAMNAMITAITSQLTARLRT